MRYKQLICMLLDCMSYFRMYHRFLGVCAGTVVLRMNSDQERPAHGVQGPYCAKVVSFMRSLCAHLTSLLARRSARVSTWPLGLLEKTLKGLSTRINTVYERHVEVP